MKACTYCDSKTHRIGNCPHLPHGDAHQAPPKKAKKAKPAKAEAAPAKPTKAEIKAEIKKLKAMKAFIPVKSMFGDNNHNSIDADIAVMEKNLTEEQIGERYLPRDEDGDDIEDDHESGKTADIEHSARMTRYWMDGEKHGDGAPSKGWESLATSRGWKP